MTGDEAKNFPPFVRTDLGGLEAYGQGFQQLIQKTLDLTGWIGVGGSKGFSVNPPKIDENYCRPPILETIHFDHKQKQHVNSKQTSFGHGISGIQNCESYKE